MEYNLIPLREFLASHSALPPHELEVTQSFATNLEAMLQGNENESEEYQKNTLASFLTKSFHYECNTKERIDLAIYDENEVKVIFECKSLSNKNEFITDKHNLDSKALYESILYYLRECITYKNNNLTFIILTNTRDFYLIDAKEYLALSKDKAIKKAFDNCDKKRGNDTSTQGFYKKLQEILPDLDFTLSYTHFTLTPNLSPSELSLIYQALSPKVLLKIISYIDANTLNQKFYDELLYILGLHEVTQNSKVLIEPSSTPNTLLDSLCQVFKLDRVRDFEHIFSLITTWNNRILFLRLLESMLKSFKHIDKEFLMPESIEDFAKLNILFFEVLAKKEKDRNASIPQPFKKIPYLNSSLFDKTALENEGKEIKLLDSKTLQFYDQSILYRDEFFKKEHPHITALPLLEYFFAFLHAYDFTTTPQDIQDNIKINHDRLINSAILGLVFEKFNGYKEGSFYTPSFITNYMCKEALEKIVIDKFNQVKNWDCQDLESLKRQIDKLTDSKDGYKEANAIFDSLSICDPSVGSGHFLVSVLNQLIALKFNLQILCDEDYQRLKDIKLEVQNDEIVIRDSANQIFCYSLPAHENIESHKLQKALFQAKRKLIESCLFGVDINPNSCEITKLRLWIELLKFSYYKDIQNKYLETLPNIDINIKCGNSLVSSIALDMTKDSLTQELKDAINKGGQLEMQEEFATMSNALNKLPSQIEIYKNAVNAYKNETNSDLKKIHQDKITESKDFIINIFHTMSAEYRVFKSLLSSYFKEYGYYGIDNAKINDKPLDSGLARLLNDYTIAFNFHKTLEFPKQDKGCHAKELLAIIDAMQRYENLKSSTDSFEWRFEFPEVLDSNGDFMGFDLIIGNPPYMQVPKGIYSKELYPYSEGKDRGKQNLYKVFIELGFNLGHTNSGISFVAQSSIMCDLSSQFTRELLLKETQMQLFVEFKDNEKIFTNVSQGVCILGFIKAKPKPNHSFKIAINNAESRMDQIDFEHITQGEILEFFPLYEIPLIKKGEMPIIAKVKKDKPLLKEMIDSSLQGNINTIHLKKIQSEKKSDITIYKGAHCHRWYFDKEAFYGFDNELTAKIIAKNQNRFIIATQNIHTATSKNRIHANFTESKNTKIVFLDSCNITYCKNAKDAKYLVGLLNSRLLNWLFRITSTNNHVNLYELESLPIPKLDSQNKKLGDKIIALVEQILESRAKDSTADTAKLESKIDALVYELYDLSEEEISIIEGK